MCIGIPAQLIERDEYSGLADIGGVQRRISLALVPDARIGDYVLVHAGCGMQIIDEQSAAETLDLLKSLESEMYE